MARVLLVEDSPTQAVEMRMLLEQASHAVIHVANGRLALSALDEHIFDVVITDLEMPELNGLELVKAMSLDYEHVPSILVTARGSEELASKALQKGAAGYVPKNHLESLLNDTIVEVLGVIRTDASFAKLISTLQKNSFDFKMPNDASLIAPTIALLIQVASGMDLLSGSDMVRFGMAVEHAMLNAMYRGNLQLGPSVTPPHRAIIYDDATSDLIETRKNTAPYKDRLVFVEATASKAEIRVVVRDQGRGFNTSDLPGREDAQVLDTESGRGLVLMRSFTDELIFNESGNEVTMIKRCS
ncbi:Transcriptional regulatory protein TcrA [Rubripirellula tenax]|uniref:Transcriptional regulatory protein TcrA n=1 Tax=Rubripirellula tenax TaxID=2528015 RepID=A0A5C6EF57_9BACT|nr:response regulator [Rubripirellula tenax]TWU47622.1 Transcriptional regulatory protein TcrA [Rubripirellula tenax]